METIDEEPNDLKVRLHVVQDELEKERRLRNKIERYCNENHCGQQHETVAGNESITWEMYRKREAEVAKLRTNVELAMNSHEKAMNLAKLQFTKELDQLQSEIASLKETSPTGQAPHEGGSVSTIEETFTTRKLEIELDELRQQKHNLEYEVKRLRVRLSEETKAKETFEEQLKDAMLQLDDLHRELDREQSARNELKISLKDAAAELEQWKSQYASGALSGPSDDPDAMSRRRLSLKMQEIDEAIQKAESASLTMVKVKSQDITTRDEQDLVLVSVEKGKRGRSSGFSLEQELQEFKIKFADSEQQLSIWKKKFEELGYLKDSLEEEVEVKISQIQNWKLTCNELKEQLKEMEVVRKEKFALEDHIKEMTEAVQRTESLENELEKLKSDFADEKNHLKAEISSQESHISTIDAARESLNKSNEDLQQKISDLETQISELNAENEKLNYSLEAAKSSLDLQGQGKSSLEQKVHSLNARLVEIQGKYVNEQQEKQELRRIFRESTVGVVQLKAKVECERIKNPDDYHELKQTLISRLTMTEEVFTEAQARARKELAVNQRSRRASVGLLPAPPAIPDKEEYEVLEWKEKYNEICREIEKAEDEVKVMAAQVARLQCVADETSEDLSSVAEEKNKLNENFELVTKELDTAKDEISNLQEYNQGLNDEIVQLNNTIKEMETAFEDDTNAKLAEICELKSTNEDLKDALEVVSKQADNAKDEIQEKTAKSKEILDELEALSLEKEELTKNNRDLEWKLKNKTIALEEETKSHKETDAELLANEKKVKELTKALEESREREADAEKLADFQQKIKDLKSKLKDEKELREEIEEDLGKMKKKLKDSKMEAEEALAAKEEEIDELKRTNKDATKQVKELKLSLKEETSLKEVAEEETARLEKKLQESAVKIEELQDPEKYGADALESNKELNKRIKDLQTQLEEEITAHEETEEELIELKNKAKGIKLAEDSELEVQVKEMKAMLDKEKAAHRNTDEELANVRKKLKEVKKELEEEQAGATRSKAEKLQQNVEEFKSALQEEKHEHENTNDLLNMIQKELNEANKKISILRNEIEDTQESEQDVKTLRKRLKELEKALEDLQNKYEEAENELQEAQKKLKLANRKVADLESDLEEAKGANNDSKAMRRKIKELEKTLAEQQEDYENADHDMAKIKKELKDAHDKISELQEESSNSKVGNREKKALERRIQELEETLSYEQADHEKTDAKLTKMQVELKEAKEKISELEEQKDGGKANSREKKAMERKIQELEETLVEEQSEHKNKFSKLQEKLKEANQKLTELEEGGSGNSSDNRQSRRRQKNDESSSEDTKELKTKIGELTMSLEEHEIEKNELISSLKKAENKYLRIQSQLEELQEHQQQLEKELTESNDDLETQLQETKAALEEKTNIVSDLKVSLNRAERRYNTSIEELDQLKSMQNMNDEDEEREIVQLQRKIENLHVALEEEMSAHEETDRELRTLEGELEAAKNLVNELRSEENADEGSPKSFKSSTVIQLKKKNDPKTAIANKNIQIKVQQLETELEEERAANQETMENYAELKKRFRSMSIELQTLKAQSSQDSEDGGKSTPSDSNLQQEIESLKEELAEEKSAHEETFSDLKQTQKRLKSIKVQLQAARAENEQNDDSSSGRSSSVVSELKIEIKNLQNALDEQIEIQEETEKTIVELKRSHKAEIKILRGHKGLPKGGNDGTEDRKVFEKQMAEVQEKYEKCLAELELSRADSNKLEEELEDAHMRIQAGKKNLQEMEEFRDEQEKEIQELKDNVKDLLEEIDDLRHAEDYSSVQRRRASKSVLIDGVGKKDMLKENQTLQKRVSELEDELEEVRSKIRKRATRDDSDDDEDTKVKEMQNKLSEALFELEAIEEILISEEKFRVELKVNLKDTMKDLEKMKNDFEDATADSGLESSAKFIKSQRRFANRMSDFEDGLAESQTKIKTVDKYQAKIAEMNKELRKYLDECGGGQGMSAYVWKSKYDTLLIQFERTEKELEATTTELESLTQINADVTAEMQQFRQENRQLQDRIDDLLKEINELKKQIADLESTKKKMEREIGEMTTAIEELQFTLDDERVRAESKIAELTQIRLDLQKEVADKDEHIERITKSYEREIKGLKEDLELERQAAIDYARHKSRMSDLLAQLQAQVEMLSESNAEFSRNNKKLQIKLKETQGFLEEEKVAHAHTCDALARCEKRTKECFRQIDALQVNLERAERMKKRVAGEAEDSFSRLDQIETRAVGLEGIKLKNEIEIDNLRSEVEELEAAAKIAEEKARASLNELSEVKTTLRKYMDLENESKKAKELAEKDLRETQIRLAGLEDVDVKQLKNQIRSLQRQNAELEEDLSSVLHQTKGFQRFEEKYERIVSNLEIDLEEWKRAAELARAENEALQMKMKKMRSQLEGAESQAMVITTKYKNAQADVDEATERADAAVRALMIKTRGLDFAEGRSTSEHYSFKGEEIVSFDNI